MPLKPCLLYISHGHCPGRSQYHHFDSLDPKTSWDQPHSKAFFSLSIAASRTWNKDGYMGSTIRELWWHCRGKSVSFMTTVTLVTTFSSEVGHLPAYSLWWCWWPLGSQWNLRFYIPDYPFLHFTPRTPKPQTLKKVLHSIRSISGQALSTASWLKKYAKKAYNPCYHSYPQTTAQKNWCWNTADWSSSSSSATQWRYTALNHKCLVLKCEGKCSNCGVRSNKGETPSVLDNVVLPGEEWAKWECSTHHMAKCSMELYQVVWQE